MRLLLIALLSCMYAPLYAQDNPADNLLFNCFKNTAAGDTEGNSVLAAFLKAAIGTFGVNNVFRSELKENDKKQYNVLLRNGDIVVLGFAELETAEKLSGLKEGSTDLLSGDIRKYAQMCCAVMAKKLQMANASTFASAVADLADGYPVENIASLLGLVLKPVKPVNVDELAHYNHIIVKNRYYIAYAYLGYYDEVKEAKGYAPLGDMHKYHSGLPCLLRRCSISEAFRVDE